MAVRRYEFYLRVVKTIFHDFLAGKHKIKRWTKCIVLKILNNFLYLY